LKTRAQPQWAARLFWLWVWLAIGAALLALAAVFSVNRQSPLPETETATRAERASYHTAISETEIDLRRARLRDFETTYPKSELLPAVRAQLSVPPPAPVRPPAPVQKRAVNTPVITAPKITRNVTPRYPRRAQRRGINAVVELSLSIDAEGEVQMVEVLRVEAERYKKQFVKAAERAALKTRYSPQTVGGRAVPAQGIKKRYVFKMD